MGIIVRVRASSVDATCNHVIWTRGCFDEVEDKDSPLVSLYINTHTYTHTTKYVLCF